MNTQAKERELFTEHRQHDDLRQATMRNRAEAELQEHDTPVLDEQAREALAEQRHDEEQLKETMLERSEAALNE